MSPAAASAEFAGRALIASLFLGGVAQKLLAPEGAREMLALAGLPISLGRWHASRASRAPG